MKAMQMHRGWGRKVSDLAYSEFVEILEDMAPKFDTVIVRVNRFYCSTRTCNECGHVNGPMPLDVRTFVCEECGYEVDRDLGAAINILREGLRILEERKAGKPA